MLQSNERIFTPSFGADRITELSPLTAWADNLLDNPTNQAGQLPTHKGIHQHEFSPFSPVKVANFKSLISLYFYI